MCTLLERFTRRGVALVSVAESLDTGSAAGRLVLNIMTAVSQWEREAIGERTRDAMSHKRTTASGWGTSSSATASARTGSTSNPTPPDRLSYWREQRRRLQERLERFNQLPAGQQQTLRNMYDR